MLQVSNCHQHLQKTVSTKVSKVELMKFDSEAALSSKSQKLPTCSADSLATSMLKKTDKEASNEIPKKTKPTKSEGYSRKNLFEYTLYSKSKFPLSTGYPVRI